MSFTFRTVAEDNFVFFLADNKLHQSTLSGTGTLFQYDGIASHAHFYDPIEKVVYTRDGTGILKRNIYMNATTIVRKGNLLCLTLWLKLLLTLLAF